MKETRTKSPSKRQSWKSMVSRFCCMLPLTGNKPIQHARLFSTRTTILTSIFLYYPEINIQWMTPSSPSIEVDCVKLDHSNSQCIFATIHWVLKINWTFLSRFEIPNWTVLLTSDNRALNTAELWLLSLFHESNQHFSELYSCIGSKTYCGGTFSCNFHVLYCYV